MPSYDYLSTVVRCRAIYLWFSFPPGNHSQVACHRTTIVRLSYDALRFHRHYRCIANPSFSVCPQNYDFNIVAHVVARCDQCFRKFEPYDIEVSIHHVWIYIRCVADYKFKQFWMHCDLSIGMLVISYQIIIWGLWGIWLYHCSVQEFTSPVITYPHTKSRRTQIKIYL